MISGDCDDPEELLQIVNRMAKVFEEADIIHRFEISSDAEIYGGVWYRWDEADFVEAVSEAPMINISRDNSIDDAHTDAASLAKRLNRPVMEHSPLAGLIAGTGPSLELRVDVQ